MASISKDAGGKKRIQFVLPNGERKAVRLGKVTMRAADQVKFRIVRILESRMTGQALDAETTQWIADLDVTLLEKLARCGLIPNREHDVTTSTLDGFVEAYIDGRTDTVADTRRLWRQTACKLYDFFGATTLLSSITRGDAKNWRISLIDSGLADASVRKHCAFAKHFFAQAIDHEIITSNPFAKLASAPVGNASRQYFVSREEIQAVLAAAPDAVGD